MELKTEDIKALEPVKFNYEELKKELTEKVENYKNLVYTEENINMAKKDRANLNKLKKAINDEKIRVKNTLSIIRKKNIARFAITLERARRTSILDFIAPILPY